VRAWRPYLKKDIEMHEKVQKRATQLIFRDRSLSYGDCKNQGLLHYLIEMFKLFKGFDDINYNIFFQSVKHRAQRS